MTIRLELDLASNVFGRLPLRIRQRLQAVVDSPNQDTWDDAYSIILNGRTFMTLWQAVIAVDPTFPRSGPVTTCDGNGRELSRETWARVPARDVLLRALRYATH
jgi:hypothetical protein